MTLDDAIRLACEIEGDPNLLTREEFIAGLKAIVEHPDYWVWGSRIVLASQTRDFPLVYELMKSITADDEAMAIFTREVERLREGRKNNGTLN